MNSALRNSVDLTTKWQSRDFKTTRATFFQVSERRAHLAVVTWSLPPPPGTGDYFYFGAAKDLPGVRELFQKKRPEAPRRNMLEIYKGLDYEVYFGNRDDQDQELLEAERVGEENLKAIELRRWADENAELIQ